MIRYGPTLLDVIVITYDCGQPKFDANFVNFADFDDFAVGSKAAKSDELDDYLHLPIENVKDPLKWWFDHQRLYPTLSRMARDYLSIPGLSFI